MSGKVKSGQKISNHLTEWNGIGTYTKGGASENENLQRFLDPIKVLCCYINHLSRARESHPTAQRSTLCC